MKNIPTGTMPKIGKFSHERHAKLALEPANRAITNIKKRLKQIFPLTEVKEFVSAAASAVSDTLGMKTQK